MRFAGGATNKTQAWHFACTNKHVYVSSSYPVPGNWQCTIISKERVSGACLTISVQKAAEACQASLQCFPVVPW